MESPKLKIPFRGISIAGEGCSEWIKRVEVALNETKELPNTLDTVFDVLDIIDVLLGNTGTGAHDLKSLEQILDIYGKYMDEPELQKIIAHYPR